MAHSIFTSLLVPETKVTGDQLATEEGILALGANLRALNRRRFLSTLAAASAVATVGGALAGRTAQAQTAAALPPVVDVLNFALNFEFLEAEFYSYGFNGQTLQANIAASAAATAAGKTPLIANAPTVTSNVLAGTEPTVTITDPTQLAILGGLLQDEAHHINLLQQNIITLGGTPITEPVLDYSAGGKMAAVTSPTLFFAAARQFTALGNSAYAGSAVDLVSNTSVLEAAAQILGAEGQHLGAINYLCIALGIGNPPDLQIDAQDVYPGEAQNPGYPAVFTVTPIGAVPYTSANATPPALGIVRNTSQVLGVVYGVSTPTTTNPAAGTVKGGFFPQGVNGNIKST